MPSGRGQLRAQQQAPRRRRSRRTPNAPTPYMIPMLLVVDRGASSDRQPVEATRAGEDTPRGRRRRAVTSSAGRASGSRATGAVVRSGRVARRRPSTPAQPGRRLADTAVTVRVHQVRHELLDLVLGAAATCGMPRAVPSVAPAPRGRRAIGLNSSRALAQPLAGHLPPSFSALPAGARYEVVGPADDASGGSCRPRRPVRCATPGPRRPRSPRLTALREQSGR